MVRIIKTEFYKLKRYHILWAGVALMLLSVLLTLFTSMANDGSVWDFAYLTEQVIKNNMSMADLQILLPEKIVYRNGKEILLNRHEFDVLVYLASHPGWVRSKEQIYEAVWTEEVVDYENAVMWCISQLRKKMEPDLDRPQYIHTVKGMGYKFEYRSEE